MFSTKLRKIGNSTGVSLRRDILDQAGLRDGDQVAVSVQDGEVRIVKADNTFNKGVEISDDGIRRYGRTFAALAE